MKRITKGGWGMAPGSLLLLVCLRFASCGQIAGEESIAEAEPIPSAKGGRVARVAVAPEAPVERPPPAPTEEPDVRSQRPVIVEAPALDPAVEFPDEPLWRATWLAIDDPVRAALPETALIDRLVDARPGQSVADIGAGGGFYTFRYASRVGRRGAVHAIDVDPLAARKIAWEAHRRSARNVTVAHVPRRRFGLDPGRFDVVLMVSTGVFATCDRAARASSMRQVATALRVGGRFVFLDATDSIHVPPPLPRCPIPSADEVIRLAAPYFELDDRVDTRHATGPSNTALRFRRVAFRPAMVPET